MAIPFRVLTAAALILLAAPAGQAEAQTTARPKASAVKKVPRKTPAPPAPAPTAAAPRPATDVRFTTEQTQSAQVSRTTTYIQGTRRRVEFPGVTAIDQCDLKRSVTLNTTAKRYRVQPYPPPAAVAAASASEPTPEEMAVASSRMPFGMPGGRPASKARGGVVTFTTTLADTLERQTLHGFEARRVKSVLVKQSSAGACDKSPLKVEVDAWYIDLPSQSQCSAPAAAAPPVPADGEACVDRLETRVAGDAKLGFPVKSVTTTTTGEGEKAEASVYAQEVTEMEVTRLEAGLFEVPADFAEANSSAEIIPALASGGSLSDALFGSTADGSSTAAPKRPGVVRIGVLEPLNRTTRTLAGTGLRQELAGRFKGSYEAIPLKGSTVAGIEAEAARLGCDYVLVSEITEIKTSKPGRMGSVMRATGGGPPKDSHDVKLDYKLFAVEATAAPKAAGNVKASTGGFGVGSALRLAAFAGRLYIGFAMMGGMGMMNPMGAMGGLSGGAGTGPLGSYFDPRATIMGAMSTGAGGGMGTGMEALAGAGDPSEAAMRDTVSDALDNEARAAMDQLSSRK